MKARSCWARTSCSTPLRIELLLCAWGAFAASSASAQVQRAAEEAALWSLWTRHVEQPAANDEIVSACRAFEDRAQGNAVVVVARGLAAWRLLKAGKPAEAAACWERLLRPTDGALGEAGAEMARRWLTRMDRERVREALRRVYLKRVAYPASLAELSALPADQCPPPADRWGEPWTYRLGGFRRLKGFESQHYELSCARLGAASDLAGALAVAYAAQPRVAAVRIMGGAAGHETVHFTVGAPAARNLYLAAGTGGDGLAFAHMGPRIIVLSTGDHWIVLQRPQAVL